MGLEWTLAHKERSERGEIAAPRLVVHSMFPGSTITDPAAARRWVRSVHGKGADGVKLRGGRGEALVAVMEETQKLGMGTSHHHDQTAVFKVNALDSARMGLDSMEHWYGLPEALFEDRTDSGLPAGLQLLGRTVAVCRGRPALASGGRPRLAHVAGGA